MKTSEQSSTPSEKSDNELIAEFMGPLACYYRQGNRKVYEYDTSWDWLMPVVEKIERLEHIPNNGIFYNVTARMEWAKVLTITIDVPIETVYKAVVNFIKWYNSQQHERK